MKKKNNFTVDYYFPTSIYTIMKPEYLDVCKTLCQEYSDKAKLDETQQLKFSENFATDSRIKDFTNLILNYSWDILDWQGYDMSNYRTYFDGFWCHHYEKTAFMEQHTHANGAHLVGFYFVKSPQNCSKVLFHDPKPGKVQAGLKEKNFNLMSHATNIVNYEPKEGMLMFAPSWLPHSFNRNMNDESMQFIHFNVKAIESMNNTSNAISNAEVI